jgi:hypothetical protein
MERRIDKLILLGLLAGVLWSAPALALKYGPYAGVEGYQEIDVADDLYLVAFHGTRSNSIEEINAAWNVRAAELCLERKTSYFIRLKFSFEPVLKTDLPVLRSSALEGTWSFIRVKGSAPAYVPIYVPSSPRVISENAPSKVAHIRCVRDPSTALSEERLQAVDPIIEDGKKRGWLAKVAKK